MMKTYYLYLTMLAFCATNVMAQPPKDQRPPTPEERLKTTTDKINSTLKLSTAQQEKIKSAYVVFFEGIEKLRKKDGKEMPPPPPPPPPIDKVAADKLAKLRDDKIKASLTEAQFKQYVELEKTLRPPHKKEGRENEAPKPPKDKND